MRCKIPNPSETKSINHPLIQLQNKASNDISTILLACTRFNRSFKTRERKKHELTDWMEKKH